MELKKLIKKLLGFKEAQYMRVSYIDWIGHSHKAPWLKYSYMEHWRLIKASKQLCKLYPNRYQGVWIEYGSFNDKPQPKPIPQQTEGKAISFHQSKPSA